MLYSICISGGVFEDKFIASHLAARPHSRAEVGLFATVEDASLTETWSCVTGVEISFDNPRCRVFDALNHEGIGASLRLRHFHRLPHSRVHLHGVSTVVQLCDIAAHGMITTSSISITFASMIQLRLCLTLDISGSVYVVVELGKFLQTCQHLHFLPARAWSGHFVLCR